MRVWLGFASILAIVAVQLGAAQATVEEPPDRDRAALIERFLAPDAQPLVSYRAFRHMTASTRGGKMQASIDAWTSLDPVHGFKYEITSREGSSLIQRKVLIAALVAEQQAVADPDQGQSALTPANYEFLDISPEDGQLLKVVVKPRRKHVMLVQGVLFIKAGSAELVRIEGELSKRPSFWTRRVKVIREYDRLEGVHVPIGMRSTADVRIAGASSFAMTYRYVEVNGKPVPGEHPPAPVPNHPQ